MILTAPFRQQPSNSSVNTKIRITNPFLLRKASDSSYSVAGNALRALGELDSDEAFKLADAFSKHPAKGELLNAMVDIFIKQGDTSKFDLMIEGFDKMPMGDEKVENLPRFAMSLLKIHNDDQVKKALMQLYGFKKPSPPPSEKKSPPSSTTIS